MGKILIAYDGSEASKKALDYAIKNARCFEEEIVILSVVPTELKMVAFEDILIPKTFKQRTQDLVNEAVEYVKKEGVNALGVTREGDVADEILKLCEELDCDLIVIGRKGLGKIERFLIGSITEKVVRHTSKSVLIVI